MKFYIWNATHTAKIKEAHPLLMNCWFYNRVGKRVHNIATRAFDGHLESRQWLEEVIEQFANTVHLQKSQAVALLKSSGTPRDALRMLNHNADTFKRIDVNKRTTYQQQTISAAQSDEAVIEAWFVSAFADAALLRTQHEIAKEAANHPIENKNKGVYNYSPNLSPDTIRRLKAYA